MDEALLNVRGVLLVLAGVLLRLAHEVEVLRRRLGRWRQSRRLAFKAGLRRLGLGKPPVQRGRGGRPRTPSATEEALCRLHLDCPHLGARMQAVLLERTTGVALSATTVRAILSRRSDFLMELRDARGRVPKRIRVEGKLARWALDFSLVWLLGVVPVWVIGVVDFHGSRVLALEVTQPTTEGTVRVLRRLFAEFGAPEVLQSDNGGAFVSAGFREFLKAHGVKHIRSRPGHPWTNGRIERVFRTFKEMLRAYAPVLLSTRHMRRVCEDFLTFYNCCRPHSAWGGLTPEEVFTGKESLRPKGRLLLFDGQVGAHRFV